MRSFSTTLKCCTSFPRLFAGLWLTCDVCVRSKYLFGDTEVAPRHRQSGRRSLQRLHSSTHGVAWRDGSKTWACMSACHQWDRLRGGGGTGSYGPLISAPLLRSLSVQPPNIYEHRSRRAPGLYLLTKSSPKRRSWVATKTFPFQFLVWRKIWLFYYYYYFFFQEFLVSLWKMSFE